MPQTSQNGKPKLEFTIFKGSTLVKTITVENGKLVKKPASLGVSSAHRHTADSLQEVMDKLDTLDKSQAAGWGIHKADKSMVFVVTVEKMEGGFAPANAITRTKEHFVWPHGAGGLMLDIDEKHAPEQAYKDIRAAAQTMFGEDVLRDVEMFYRPSTSAGCYVKSAGRTEQSHGARIYLAVSRAKDIITLGKLIYDGLWINGKGRVVPSKAGTPLYRTLIDDTVWSPERIDYVGPAIKGDGVGYEPPDRHRWGIAGRMADLSEEQLDEASTRESAAANARESALVAAKPILEKARKKWMDERLSAERELLRKQGISDNDIDTHLENSKITLQSASAGATLTPRFVLYLNKDHTEEVTIADIMKEPTRFHGKRCCDPLEPDGTFGKAKIYTNGRIVVSSFLHGGATYRAASVHRYGVPPLEKTDRAGAVATLSKAIDIAFPSQVFIRDGVPVRVSSDGRLVKLTVLNLPLFLDKGLQFQKQGKKQLTPHFLDNDHASDYIQACSDPLAYEVTQPEVLRVVNRPMWFPETEAVVSEPGYDPKTKLYFSFDDEFPPLPVINSAEDAKAIAKVLIAPYQDFPIHNPDSKPNYPQAIALTLCLQAAIRPTVVTPAPMIDANGAGVGKTKLTQCYIAGTGKRITPVRWSHNEEEAGKVLVAWSLTGSDHLVIENHDGIFKNEALESIIDKRTDEKTELRILGVSANVSIRNDFLLIANGINIRAGGSAIARRTLRILLESGADAAWATKQFSFKGDPTEYILANWRARHMMCLALVKWGAGLGWATPSRFNAMPDFDKHIRQLVHRIYKVDVLETIVEDVSDVIEANSADSPKGRVLYHASKMLKVRELDPLKKGWFVVGDLRDYLNANRLDPNGVLSEVLKGTKALSAAGEINGMKWVKVPGKVDNSQKWTIGGNPITEPDATRNDKFTARAATGETGGVVGAGATGETGGAGREGG